MTSLSSSPRRGVMPIYIYMVVCRLATRRGKKSESLDSENSDSDIHMKWLELLLEKWPFLYMSMNQIFSYAHPPSLKGTSVATDHLSFCVFSHDISSHRSQSCSGSSPVPIFS